MLKKAEILKDINTMKSKGFLERLDKMYRRLPETVCDSCGVCCSDSPIVTYLEFIRVFDFMESQEKFTPEIKLEILKKAVRENFIGTISWNRICPFLDQDKKCMIHSVAPISCKRWGHQSKDDNQRDWDTDFQRNRFYQDHYAKHGITIPDEVINKQTPYCEKVKIVKNPYQLIGQDFHDIGSQIAKMSAFFGRKNATNLSLGDYFNKVFVGEKFIKDKYEVLRSYQQGNSLAIEEYIETLNFDDAI